MQEQMPPASPVLPLGQSMGFSSEELQAKWEQKQAKKDVRRVSNGLGAGMLLIQGIGTVLALLLPFLIDLIFQGASQNGGVFYDAMEYALYAPVSLLLSMWLGLKIAKGSFGEVVPYEKCRPFLWFACILFSFFFIFVGNFLGDIAIILSPHTAENISDITGEDPINFAELLLQILYVAAIPALAEELAFRGIVFGSLRKYGDGFAMVMSSVLFAVLHGNFVQIPFAFCMGIALAYTVIRTGSIVPAILIHFINNAMSCFISYFSSEISSVGDGLLFKGLLYGTWAIIGVFGFLLLQFCFKQKPLDCFQKYEGCLTTGARTGAFFGGAVMIVNLVVYLGTAVLLAFPLEML